MNAARSIRRRLLVSLSVTAVVVWALVATVAYLNTSVEVGELYDGELAELARVLLTLYTAQALVPQDSANRRVTLPSFANDDNYEHKLGFQIWDGAGRLRVRSAKVPDAPLSLIPSGYSTRDIYGSPSRIYALRAPGEPVTVQVTQHISIRRDLAADLVQTLFIIILVGLPVMLWLMRSSVIRGLAPLARITTQIRARAPDNLQPMDLSAAPVEIQALTDALNRLLRRLAAAFERERRFTADATHELRTPLAGLKAHAQLAMRARSGAERSHSLARIDQSIDRTTRLVEQLLALTRADAAPPTGRRPVNLADAVPGVLQDLDCLIARKRIAIQLACAPDTTVHADPDLLHTLIRNLADNAIRYTAAGGTVRIAVERGAAVIRLTIADNGPGIPAAKLARVFDRFYRVPGAAEPGSGLGLSIVKRIAEAAGATVRLTNHPAGGLTAIVEFPV